jgi:hypothetical protein
MWNKIEHLVFNSRLEVFILNAVLVLAVFTVVADIMVWRAM